MADEYIERIAPYLASHGVTDFCFEHLAKHRAVVIHYRGRSYRVVFPLTGSDWRGPANTISTIRHVLGLFEPKAPQADVRRVRRHRPLAQRTPNVSRVSFSEPITPRPDKFLGPLMILKARLEAGNAVAEGATAAEAASTNSAGKPARIALRTPWLGRQARYAKI